MASRTAARFRSANNRRRRLISLTPLIDVVFILLVFFMLVSSFLDWRVITLDSDTAEVAASDAGGGLLGAVVVDIDADGGLYLSGEPMDLQTMAARVEALAARRNDLSVVVRPAPGVPVQGMVDMLDLMAAGGVVSLSVQRAP